MRSNSPATLAFAFAVALVASCGSGPRTRDLAGAGGGIGSTGGGPAPARDSGATAATGGSPAAGDGGDPVDAAGGRGDLPARSDADAADTPPPVERWSCPPGPFEPPVAGPSRAVCTSFPFKYDWNEGPTWVAGEGAFFFSNFVVRAAGPGDMIKFTLATGACETFIADVGCNGLAAAGDGHLLAACQTPRALMRYDLATRKGTVVADMAGGQVLDAVNDVVVHSNGTIYFTNPLYELGGRPAGLGQAVLRVDPAGAISIVGRGAVNGIALSPDERRLYVVLQGVWDLDAAGVPSNPRPLELGRDGIAVDCAGNIYDSTGSIRDPQGQVIGSFPAGTNMSFGGPDGRTLFVVRNGTAHTVEMNVPGLP